MISMWLSTKFGFFLLYFSVLILVSCQGVIETELPADEFPEEEQAISFIFEDEFSDEEKLKLEEWISFTSDCAQKTLGRFPFDLYYHFHREDSSDRAVVFGHTARIDTFNAAHFYIDPSYSLEDLKADWIAPHEISHLAIPRLAKSNMWFFEGFATYLSREVMIEMEVFTRHEVDSINQTRIVAVKDKFTSTSTLAFVADSLITNHHQYPAVYWIGASYFHTADKLLVAEKKMKLIDILKEFQVCCHEPGMTVLQVVESFDQIGNTNIFGELYIEYTEAPVYTLLIEYE
jgi:hypothetical protein